MASARQPLDPAIPLVRPSPFATALRHSPECPTCGRKSALVFPDVRVARSAADAPLACLDCCCAARGLSAPGGSR